MASIRQQTRVAGARERRTALLYAMSRELAATRGLENMAAVAVRHVAEVFEAQAVVLLPDAAGRLHRPRADAEAGFVPRRRSLDRPVGAGSRQVRGTRHRHAARRAGHLPAAHRQSRRTLGVLAVLPANPRRVLLPEQRFLLETFAGQTALALERAQLADAGEVARIAAERESLRNTLLSSISHDLRTPLAVIGGAGSTLLDQGERLDAATRGQLARTIVERARRDVAAGVERARPGAARTGEVRPRLDWQTVDDLVGTALGQHREVLATTPVTLDLPPDLPPVAADAALMVQVLGNLLENAARYTPAGTRITMSADASSTRVRLVVEDEGPGLPPGDPERLFDKFQRGREEEDATGAGLGLTICRAILRMHGGESAAPRGRRRRPVRAEAAGPVTDQAMHRVLVVEDDPSIRQVLRALLESQQYRVVEAPTAQRAVIEARAHQPDAGIVDLGLPDRDGQEVIRAIRRGRCCPSWCCRPAASTQRRSPRWTPAPTTTSPSHSTRARSLRVSGRPCAAAYKRAASRMSCGSVTTSSILHHAKHGIPPDNPCA